MISICFKTETHTDTSWFLGSFVSRNCLATPCGFKISFRYCQLLSTPASWVDLIHTDMLTSALLQTPKNERKQQYGLPWWETKTSIVKEHGFEINVWNYGIKCQYISCAVLQSYLPHLGRDNSLNSPSSPIRPNNPNRVTYGRKLLIMKNASNSNHFLFCGTK